MVSPANTAVELTNPDFADPRELAGLRPTGKINFCRVVPGDDQQARFAAEWSKELGFKRVVVLDDNEVYGKGIATLYAENCERLGIEVAYRDSIDVKSQEFRSLMTRIKSYEPDLIYFGGTTQSKGGQLAKDMIEAGLSCQMMVPDGCYEEAFIESAGARVNDRVYVTFGGLPPSEQRGAGLRFVERYRQQHSADPDVFAIYGYEAASAVVEAIRRAGKKDREAILEACLAIKDFSRGALGTWSFDENGDITNSQISGNAIRDGKFVFVKKWAPRAMMNDER
jgi:branched-chain amino acid transport system substrate-binding protein